MLTMITAPRAADNSTTTRADTDEEVACGICMDARLFIKLPCCGRTEATTQYCGHCIGLLCARAPGGVAHCPSCRNPITLNKSGSVVVATRPVTFVRNQLQCECCRKAYNDWQVQHVEWEKLPAALRTQNLCRDCYGAAIQPIRLAFVTPALLRSLLAVLALFTAVWILR